MYLVLPSYNTFNLFTLYRCDKAIHMCNHIFIYFSFFLSVLQCFKQQYQVLIKYNFYLLYNGIFFCLFSCYYTIVLLHTQNKPCQCLLCRNYGNLSWIYVFFSSCVLLCPFKILFAFNFSNIITFSLPVSTEPSAYMCVILVSFYGMFYCCLLNNQTLKLITKSNRVSLLFYYSQIYSVSSVLSVQSGGTIRCVYCAPCCIKKIVPLLGRCQRKTKTTTTTTGCIIRRLTTLCTQMLFLSCLHVAALFFF